MPPYEETVSPGTAETNSAMPKWFKLFFRMCVVLLLVGVIFTVAKFAIGAAEQARVFYSFFFESPIFIFAPFAEIFSPINFFILGLLALAALLIVLIVFYGVGLLRFQRWTLSILLFFVASSLLVGLLGITLGNFMGISELISAVLGLIFIFGIGYSAWLYRAAFVGSARKLWIQIPLLAVLVPTVFLATLSQVYTDDDAIHDTDLILPDVAVLPEADNAHFALPNLIGLSPEERSALDQAREYYRALERGEHIDISSASIALENLIEIADRFIVASQKQGYQCPSSVNAHGLDTVICPVGLLRDMAQVVALRSYVEAARGNIEAAIESALAPARLGKLMSAEQPLLIEHLTGISLVRIGMESVGRVVNQAPALLSAETASAIARELETYELDGLSLERSLKREHMSGKETLRPFERFSGYVWHHNRTNNELAEWMWRNIEIARTTCDGNAVEQKINALKTDIDKRARNVSGWTLVKPNGLGEVLKSMVISGLGGSRERECEVNEINEALQQRLRAM